jgi:hypothetical protein
MGAAGTRPAGVALPDEFPLVPPLSPVELAMSAA